MGAALTADNGLGDILTPLAALHNLQEGDILVAGSDQHRDCVEADDRLCSMIENAGGVGLVTNGPVRNPVIRLGCSDWWPEGLQLRISLLLILITSLRFYPG